MNDHAIRNLQIDRCEIPDRLDATRHHMVADILGLISWYGNDSDAHLLCLAKSAKSSPNSKLLAMVVAEICSTSSGSDFR